MAHPVDSPSTLHVPLCLILRDGSRLHLWSQIYIGKTGWAWPPCIVGGTNFCIQVEGQWTRGG
ncbi:hypothetical protein PVAP13_7KG191555 [Panicum virgatum]|uniref:Uncharacterized protein n=1 Tax=Panicum virgatum TaxID=38727 RepID=A0A8T0QIJ3_PANVG|nr:hypothetical protein PVAP13_7KG191555 [Panicum virgatum]